MLLSPLLQQQHAAWHSGDKAFAATSFASVELLSRMRCFECDVLRHKVAATTKNM